jgi:Fanconi anemia group M protein
MNKLIIDSREKSSLSEYIISEASLLNIPSEKQWLEIGDYVYQDVCFEAKSTIDFLQSVINKRLWNQVDNMDRHYEYSIVIIHGSLHQAMAYPDYVNIPITEKMLKNKFYGAIGKLTLDTDCKVFWVESPQKAAKIVTTICKMRPVERAVIQPSLLKRITTDDLRLDMLCTIKGVSKSKAEKIIKKHGSLMEVGECSVEELSSVDGIGPTIAKRIIDTLNSENKVIV